MIKRQTEEDRAEQTPLEKRAEGGAGASEGLNTRSHTGFCSDPEPRAQFIFLNFWD